MRKVVTVALCILAAVCLWCRAFDAGIQHAICDSEMYIVEYDDPDVTEYDTIVYIDLDDSTYSHGLYVG